jgi:cytoskeleton protein RodZ
MRNVHRGEEERVASLQEVGQRLKQAREAQGLSLNEISARTRITLRHLKALEEGAEGELPEVFYIRGFLKKYAEVVGLSPGDVADAYRSAPVPTAPLPDLRQGTGRWGYYVLVAALLTGLLALAWYFQPRVSVVEAPQASPMLDTSPTPMSPSPSAVASLTVDSSPSPGAVAAVGAASPTVSPPGSPAVSGSPSPVPAVVASKVPALALSPTPQASAPAVSASSVPGAKPQVAVRLNWVGRSWVEVRVDGILVLEGILSSGTSREFFGREIEVSAGNAGGVKVVVDGRDLGLFGRYGEVVTRTYRPKP